MAASVSESTRRIWKASMIFASPVVPACSPSRTASCHLEEPITFAWYTTEGEIVRTERSKYAVPAL